MSKVPFGKYRNQPISSLLKDANYVTWCKQQPWFKSKYPKIYDIIMGTVPLKGIIPKNFDIDPSPQDHYTENLGKTARKQILRLGAINKLTNDYVLPINANKKDNYICPDCKKDLILCVGTIKVPYAEDTAHQCTHYNAPTESQIHKSCKLLMKQLLDNRKPISFVRKCVSCHTYNEITMPSMIDKSRIEIEYRFEMEGKTKIADVAHLIDDKIACIFEICIIVKIDQNHGLK